MSPLCRPPVMPAAVRFKASSVTQWFAFPSSLKDRLPGLGDLVSNYISPKALCPKANVGMGGSAGVDACRPKPPGRSVGARVTYRYQDTGTASQNRDKATSVPGELHDLLLLALKCSVCEMVITFFAESGSDCSLPQSPFLPTLQDPLPSVKAPGVALVPRNCPSSSQSWPLPQAATRTTVFCVHVSSSQQCRAHLVASMLTVHKRSSSLCYVPRRSVSRGSVTPEWGCMSL